MNSTISQSPLKLQGYFFRLLLALGIVATAANTGQSQESASCSEKPKVAASDANTQAQMKAYTQILSATDAKFEMVPIRGGTFTMGRAETDEENADEGPQIKVKIEPFWMCKHEVTWNVYDIFSFRLDEKRRQVLNIKPTVRDPTADAVTRPTKPYVDMTFDMGHEDFPAICMTQLAAKQYCKWISAKTGHYYRLPTEAEWEYACRAGSKGDYSFGDASKIDDFAWHYDNSDEKYHRVGTKKPNPWGLHDMHGNVSEWVLDQYIPDQYKKLSGKKILNANEALAVTSKLYPRIVRGGSWDDDIEDLRSSKRYFSEPEWKIEDPQLPQSIWYHTDAQHVGFRIIRPLVKPNEATRKKLKLDAPPVKNERE